MAHNPPIYYPAPVTSPVTAIAPVSRQTTQLVHVPQNTALVPYQQSPQPFMHQIQADVKQSLSDQVTPIRLAGHIAVVIIAATIFILSRVDIPNLDISLGNLITSPNSGEPTVAVGGSQLGSAIAGNAVLQRIPLPFTKIIEPVSQETTPSVALAPERQPLVIQNYVVKANDTVVGIAQRYGLRPETLQWANKHIENNPHRLSIGDNLTIPPTDGVLHTVTARDTVATLAKKYKTTIEKVIGYQGNNLADQTTPLVIGDQVMVVGGRKPFIQQQTPSWTASVTNRSNNTGTVIKATGSFGWPASGSINQNYWGGHPAIDIGAWTGSPVRAADAGHVVLATGGWNGGYGNHIIIDHGNGFATLYAHLNSIYVHSGEYVANGQQIGTMGSTGNSTGPHLHFEVRYNGRLQNPIHYLK
ncbi:MAG: peptidoglycan DD-metalloendopeptidase family protein [Chloroflexota bacterium]